MIKLGFDLFKIPPNLAVDIRAYWSKKTLQPVKVRFYWLFYNIYFKILYNIIFNNRKKEQLLQQYFHLLIVQLPLKKMKKTQQ